MPEACEIERKKSKDTHLLLTPANTINQTRIGELIKSDNFSSKERLLRLTARVMKCAKLWKHKAKKANADLTSDITAADLQEAENHWMKEIQDSLTSHPRFSTWQWQFGLFLDNNGVWRCGGRLTKADLPFTTKHPLLLDQRHHLTTLIVREAHERVQHNGVKETLTELRSKYWIIRGRSFVRRILH